MTANELLKTVPPVLRARGFRLYTQNGNRLVDLWLNGGAAVLGHTPPNLLRELKNAASRGLYAPLPHFAESRFQKALSLLFPGRAFRLYAAPPAELVQLFKEGTATLWRPFAGEMVPDTLSGTVTDTLPVTFFMPVLPGIQLWRDELPVGLCVVAAETESQLAALPAGDILSPVLLAVAARGVHDILASEQRAKLNYPRIAKALKSGAQKWEREGIYLYPKEKPAPEEWAALFAQFLEAGFLLPPTPSQPLILPGELSDGEEAKLADILVPILVPGTTTTGSAVG